MPRETGLRRAPGRLLPAAFYARDTLAVARDLLGCLVCRREDTGLVTVGRIVETEAYVGEDDPACHAAAGRTPRTEVLYGPPGRAYIYFNYGMHFLLNAVTEPEGRPAAVLLRALRPVAGLDRMRARRGPVPVHRLQSGPARLCQALGLDLGQNRLSLRSRELSIRKDGYTVEAVDTGPRIGIRTGLDRPWRFWMPDDPHVSPGRAEPRARGRRTGPD